LNVELTRAVRVYALFLGYLLGLYGCFGPPQLAPYEYERLIMLPRAAVTGDSAAVIVSIANDATKMQYSDSSSYVRHVMEDSSRYVVLFGSLRYRAGDECVVVISKDSAKVLGVYKGQ
jgi:hypothetical protein